MALLRSKTVADDIKRWAADFEKSVGNAASTIKHEHGDLDNLHMSFKRYIFILSEDMEDMGKEGVRENWANINSQLEKIANHLADMSRSLRFLKKTQYSEIFQGVYEKMLAFIRGNTKDQMQDDHRLRIQTFCSSMIDIFGHLKGLLREVDDKIIEKEQRVESLEKVLMDFARKHNKI